MGHIRGGETVRTRFDRRTIGSAVMAAIQQGYAQAQAVAS